MGLPRLSMLFAAVLAASLAACSSGDNGLSNKTAGQSGDWREGFTQIRMGTRASEEDPIALLRVELLNDYLSEITGLPVKMYQASDYNSIIQALAAGQIHMASMGAGSYTNIHDQVGDLAEPILVRRDAYGSSGYYSGLLVRRDSPYHSIEDLKGKTLAYVDFNSTSGYLYPRHIMRQQGIDPDTYFAKAALGGGHLQSVMALLNGQFDATLISMSGGNPEIGFSDGTVARLAKRGIIDPDEFRAIWFAGPIPNSPRVVRSDLPHELQDLMRGAIAAMPFDAPEVSASMARLPGNHYRAVDHTFFTEVVEMREAEIKSHRKRAIGGSR